MRAMGIAPETGGRAPAHLKQPGCERAAGLSASSLHCPLQQHLHRHGPSFLGPRRLGASPRVFWLSDLSWEPQKPPAGVEEQGHKAWAFGPHVFCFKSNSWACLFGGGQDRPALRMSRQAILGHFPKAGLGNIPTSSKTGGPGKTLGQREPQRCFLGPAPSVALPPRRFYPSKAPRASRLSYFTAGLGSQVGNGLMPDLACNCH